MARAPGSSKVSRTAETKFWKQRWEDFRANSSETPSKQLDELLAGKCDGYRYLFTIHSMLALENEVLAEAVAVIQVLGLDGPDWRHKLDQIGRPGGGDMHDNFAFAAMKDSFKSLQTTNQKRAAEHAVATMGLYPDAQSFGSAVTRCRAVWSKYKLGKFQPLGHIFGHAGIVVRPRLDNLKQPDERRLIIDPADMVPLPDEGKRVQDNVFWRNMAELNLVEILQDQ